MTMSLSGGLDMYSSFDGESFKRFKSDKTPFGRRVIFLNKNGYDADREYANQFMNEGDVLTIDEIYVGRSSSDVEFVEFTGKKFNTVMFDDVE